jgi:hypothetical protein
MARTTLVLALCALCVAAFAFQGEFKVVRTDTGVLGASEAAVHAGHVYLPAA